MLTDAWYLAQHVHVEMQKVSEHKLRVDAWFGKRKDLACVRTVCSHIENMINGVQTVC
jgi:large subunit ribosomal protein L9e